MNKDKKSSIIKHVFFVVLIVCVSPFVWWMTYGGGPNYFGLTPTYVDTTTSISREEMDKYLERGFFKRFVR